MTIFPMALGISAITSLLLLVGCGQGLAGQAAGEDVEDIGVLKQEVSAISSGLAELTGQIEQIEEAIEDVPASVSVLTSDDITKSGMRSISDAVGRVPNLHFTEFSARRLSFPYVRGIGSGLGEPSVATYVDGVPQLSVGSTNLPLLGMERIEFLRGPQGTLYGRNAMGGVINIVGRQPGEQAVSSAGALFGNHALQEYSYSYAGPMGKDAGLVFDGMFSSRDGYTTNDLTGNTVDDREAFTGRVQMSLAPSDSSSLRIGVSGQMADDGGFGLYDLASLRSNPHHIENDFDQRCPIDPGFANPEGYLGVSHYFSRGVAAFGPETPAVSRCRAFPALH